MSGTQTPVKPTQPPHDVHSTPYSAGSGSNLTYDTNTTHLHYSPYLYQDLRNEKTMPFTDFCKNILRFEFDEAPSQNSTTQRLGDLLATYRRPVETETDRYEPFVELANYILQRSKSSYTFVRNDPKHLWGIDPGRKPDVLFVHQSADSQRSKGGSDVAFHPCDIISFDEFKLLRKDLTGKLPLRPTSSVNEFFGNSARKRKADTPENTSEGRVRKSPRAGSSSATVPRAKGSDLVAGRNLEEASTEDETPSAAALADHPLIQCASYALEMLSKGFRRHVISFLITDGQIECLYYDHSVVLRSSPFSFVDDLPRFQQLISHLGRMTLTDYGFYPDVIPATPDQLSEVLFKMRQKSRNSILNIFDDLRLNLNNGIDLTLGDIVHHPHGLIGRGSLVVKVKPTSNLPEEWPKRIVVKLSWLPISRQPEHAILKAIESAIKDDSEAKWVSDHLPRVLHSQDYPPGVIADSLFEYFKDDYETRRLYLLVMEGLDCIDLIQDCDELKGAYIDIVRCHRWIHDGAKILHRDISVKNLMFRRRAGGNILGVLNDFDLATRVANLDNGPTSKQRTGTWPYLAIELLDPSTWLHPPRHRYRYDLESFFWVLVTLAVDSKRYDKNEILKWPGFSHGRLYDKKKSFLLGGTRTTPWDPQYEGLKGWLTSLSYLFARAIVANELALMSGVPEKDTIDELVTGDSFVQILDH